MLIGDKYIESIIIIYSLLISALCCDVALFKIIKKNVEIDTFNTQLSIDFALMLNKMTRFYYILFHPQRYRMDNGHWIADLWSGHCHCRKKTFCVGDVQSPVPR